eukprot:TRINITY_DN51379_c0_g1_i1.p1 TRINITY_DN51379_c0_g1~~TRINITY_DN51379_c0_g1_i1.p1  ORF type:complete len:440 (+),score=62.57 TRINITY_DN51379_c0_g1_i1:83-1321(+)
MEQVQAASSISVAAMVIDTLAAGSARNKEAQTQSHTDEAGLPVDGWADFECIVPPAEPIIKFCTLRMSRACRPELWPLVLILIDRLCRMTNIKLNVFNVHRLVTTAVSLTVKYSSDCCGVSQAVSALGGVDNDDLVDMELCFLLLIDWRLEIPSGAYDRVIQKLPQIKAAAMAPASSGAPLIPDGILLLRERLGVPVCETRATRASTGDSTAPLFPSEPGSPDLRALTAVSDACVSVLPYEVTPLSMLPMPDLAVAEDELPPSGAIENFRPRQLTVDSPLDAESEVLPCDLGPSRSWRSRCSWRTRRCSTKRLVTPSTSPSGSPMSARSRLTPPLPQPPKQPRSCPSGRQHAHFVANDHCEPAEPPCGAFAASHQPAAPPAVAAASCSSTGKRARIEAARSFNQTESSGSLL